MKTLLAKFVMLQLMDGGISQPQKVNSFKNPECHLSFSKNITFLACGCHINCFEEDTDYEGDDLSDNVIEKVANANACQLLCHNRADCLFWTYLDINLTHDWAGRCWLKDGKGTIRNEGHEGYTSGPKYCSKYLLIKVIFEA